MILEGGFTLQIADMHAEGYLGCGYPMRPQIELVMFWRNITIFPLVKIHQNSSGFEVYMIFEPLEFYLEQVE